MITYDGIIKNIRQIIIKKEVKQRTIARKAGYDEKAFSNMLNHRKKMPADAIPKIANALEVDIATLFAESNDSSKTA